MGLHQRQCAGQTLTCKRCSGSGAEYNVHFAGSLGGCGGARLVVGSSHSVEAHTYKQSIRWSIIGVQYVTPINAGFILISSWTSYSFVFFSGIIF